MEPLWQLWRQGFTQWEQATAKLFDTALKSPALLEPSGQALSSLMRGKRQLDEMTASFWANLGLPVRRDQERMLHLLNQLQSRLFDLEERLEEMEERLGRAGAPTAPPPSQVSPSVASSAAPDVPPVASPEPEGEGA